MIKVANMNLGTGIRFFQVLIIVSILVFAVVAVNLRKVRYQETQAVQGTAPTPETFYKSYTHPHFYPREGEIYVGKRFIGTKANSVNPERQFMKAWSGPISGIPGNRRQIVYQHYLGWEDKPGKIAEWEEWERLDPSTLMVYRFGSPVVNTTRPYWYDAWMNSIYTPINTNSNYFWYTCSSGSNVSTPGVKWPTVPKGATDGVVYVTRNTTLNPAPTCDQNNRKYIGMVFRQDFGTPYSQTRKDLCLRYVHPVWGRTASAYNICVDAPYVGRFDQRYGGGPGYGCEPVIYAWGYPESGPTHKYFRNGELRWMDFVAVAATSVYYSYNDETFWAPKCDAQWRGDYNSGGWIYEGIYQKGIYQIGDLDVFYLDKGDQNTPVQNLSRYSPSPTPVPYSKTSVWNEACSFQGEQWCQLGTTCDTGWVGGPRHEVSCPSGKRLRNTGTYYRLWNGLSRFSGKTECVSDTTCL